MSSATQTANSATATATSVVEAHEQAIAEPLTAVYHPLSVDIHRRYTKQRAAVIHGEFFAKRMNRHAMMGMLQSVDRAVANHTRRGGSR